MPGWIRKAFEAITIVVPIVRRAVERRRNREAGKDSGGGADDPRGLVAKHRKATK